MSVLFKLRVILCIRLTNLFSGTHFFVAKRNILRLAGVHVGVDTKVVGPIRMSSLTQLSIGSNCWIGTNFTILGDGNVIIGNNNDIAPDFCIITGSHEIGTEKRRAGRGITWNYRIGDGNWFGAQVTISNGVSVGSGNVIGARSLILDDCSDNYVYVGTPAKSIRPL